MAQVAINGVAHDVRPLTLKEVRACGKYGDDGDAYAVAWACGIMPAEALAWFDAVPAGEAMAVLAVIHDVSGLTGAARFPDAPSDDAGDAGSAQRD